jgi:hypothetical protein
MPGGPQAGGGTRRRRGDLCNSAAARYRLGGYLTNPPGGEHASDGLQRWHERGPGPGPHFAPNLYAEFLGSKSASVKPLLTFTFM